MHLDDELTAASAAPLVLAILAEGESSGYAIVQRLRESSGGQLEWADGVAYPLFRRLHRLGYVRSEWRVVSAGWRRRYYALTDEVGSSAPISQAARTDRGRR